MPVLFSFSLWPDAMATKVMYMLSAPFLITVTLLVGAFHRVAFSRLLETRPLVYVGQLSYTIYLWQELATGFQGEHRPPLFHVVAVALVVLWAVVSYRLIERPIVSWGAERSRRLIARLQARVAPGCAVKAPSQL
jgi:peptidoglycan/LPS O-acetylase OafA/YrhL